MKLDVVLCNPIPPTNIIKSNKNNLQTNYQQTNKSCRPSYCHLSSLCDIIIKEACWKVWIKTWQIRLLIKEEGRVDGGRMRASQFSALYFYTWNQQNMASACNLVYPQMDSQEPPNNWADTLLLLYSAGKQSLTTTTTTITQQVLVG